MEVGRPKSGDGEKKKQTPVYLPPAELAAFRAHAKSAGDTLAVFLRKLLLADLEELEETTPFARRRATGAYSKKGGRKGADQ